ncbi:hypothetical protein [Amycolatopsis eburnea]|uniref:hypothetical protein n=1 Tax=Amycolatopsis eburnea TaxID=2267691 RepID=UPI0013156702|nr:hypothetical protein [Amycolatopsis eburnea]
MGITDAPLRRITGNSPPSPSELAAMLRLAFMRSRLADTSRSVRVYSTESEGYRA